LRLAPISGQEAEMNGTHQWLQAIGVGIAIGGSVASAQAPDPSTMSREVVSASGCVQRATPAEATAGGERIDGAFVLRGARLGGSPVRSERPALPATSPGTPTSNEGSESTNTAEPGSGAPPVEARASGNDMASPAPRDAGLLLAADRSIDLAEHVGHRVIVTGTLSSFASPDGVASTASGRTLTVTKVTLIAPACTAGS
jgi:hypothetical protein